MLSKNEELVLEACKGASKNRPITRLELKIITKLNDSDNREIIGRLRDYGYRIAHSNKGYWYANDAEYSEWISRYVKNANTIYKRKAAMDNFVEGQAGIDG